MIKDTVSHCIETLSVREIIWLMRIIYIPCPAAGLAVGVVAFRAGGAMVGGAEDFRTLRLQ